MLKIAKPNSSNYMLLIATIYFGLGIKADGQTEDKYKFYDRFAKHTNGAFDATGNVVRLDGVLSLGNLDSRKTIIDALQIRHKYLKKINATHINMTGNGNTIDVEFGQNRLLILCGWDETDNVEYWVAMDSSGRFLTNTNERGRVGSDWGGPKNARFNGHTFGFQFARVGSQAIRYQMVLQ